MREEVTGKCGKMHTEELLFTNINKAIRSRECNG
jgi:hypothetical protein